MNQFFSKTTNTDDLKPKISCETCSISQLCIPNSLSKTDVLKLDNIISRGKPFHKGMFLHQADDCFKNLYAVSSGSFKSYTLSEDGVINITGFYFPGEK